MLGLDILELFITTISVIAIIGSVAIIVTSQFQSTSKEHNKFTADFFGHGAITNAFRASMNDKFNDQQIEVVQRIVWRYSSVPLTAILENPKERYNIYRGLSDPNQYPWDTSESDYVQ